MKLASERCESGAGDRSGPRFQKGRASARGGWLAFALAFAGLAPAARGGLDFDVGADLRIRQEIMENVPGLPGGGLTSQSASGKTRNHMRFRPRAWGEFTGVTRDNGTWRLFARVADEFRWNVNYTNRSNEFPDELYLDNLYLDAAGVFDGFLDFRAGRQDIVALYGLDHVFTDGTPGDGSRSAYADVVRTTLHVTEESTLDFLAIYDSDANRLRWGDSRCRNRRETALAPYSEPEMDDFGFGLVWGSTVTESLPYQLFAVSKRVRAWHDARDVKHSGWYRELLGVKTTPRLTDDLSLQFEGMSQLGETDDDDFICAWSAYAGGRWSDASKASWRPFVTTGLHWMSGDGDASEEDGGHRAWDPMWSRAENDSCLFQYGTLYGVGFWSNMYFWKTSAGYEFSAGHSLTLSSGPIFADEKDGLGGGDGAYKGLLSQIRWEFPIFTNAMRRQLSWGECGSGVEMRGHLVFEHFAPGDYYASDRPATFVRWQVEFLF